MGAGAGGYVNIQTITHVSRAGATAGTWDRTSRLVFTPAETPSDRKPLPALPPSAGPTPGATPAGKVALYGLGQGEVAKFNLYAFTDKARSTLIGMGTEKRDAIAQEARKAFGGRDADWAGFAVALGPSGGIFDLVADVTLIPRWPSPSSNSPPAVKPFQVIPVVMAFGTDSFADHYLLSVIVAQKTSDLVDTAVTQPYQ
jgi:hypothetical protein